MHDIVAFTGHRPDKIGGYDRHVFRRLVGFTEEIIREHQPVMGICGMALGFDQAAAQACCNLGIPWIAAVPFAGQESRWRRAAQLRYVELLEQASDIHIVVPGGFTNHAMLKRNKWMVENATKLIALWDGSDGGTSHCVQYATGRIPIINYWERWVTPRPDN